MYDMYPNWGSLSHDDARSCPERPVMEEVEPVPLRTTVAQKPTNTEHMEATQRAERQLSADVASKVVAYAAS